MYLIQRHFHLTKYGFLIHSKKKYLSHISDINCSHLCQHRPLFRSDDLKARLSNGVEFGVEANKGESRSVPNRCMGSPAGQRYLLWALDTHPANLMGNTGPLATRTETRTRQSSFDFSLFVFLLTGIT